jgi:hypothetical protein
MLNKLKNWLKSSTDLVKTEAVETPVSDPVITESEAKPEPVKKRKRSAKPKTERKSKKNTKSKIPELSAKEQATANGEPYIAILKVDVDPQDPSMASGSFELDWNEKFVVNLIKAGYKIRSDDTDQDIVERWYQTICRNVALELYEQYQADPENRASDMRVIRTKDIGNGRTEVS